MLDDFFENSVEVIDDPIVNDRLASLRNKASGLKVTVVPNNTPAPYEFSHEQRVAEIKRQRTTKWNTIVPPIWAKWDIDSLPHNLAESASQWVAGKHDDVGNLILLGPTGTGKTALGYAVCREKFLEGKRVDIFQITDLLAKLNPKADAPSDVLKLCKSTDILMIDDVGVEKGSEWVEQTLFSIIDYRWQWLKPTILTTNKTKEQLFEHLKYSSDSDRIYSRLVGGATVLEVLGKDFRK